MKVYRLTEAELKFVEIIWSNEPIKKSMNFKDLWMSIRRYSDGQTISYRSKYES